MGNGFHDEDELYDMQKHPNVQAIRIGRTKPYECSYPVLAEKPKITAEGVNYGKIGVCNRKR